MGQYRILGQQALAAGNTALASHYFQLDASGQNPPVTMPMQGSPVGASGGGWGGGGIGGGGGNAGGFGLGDLGYLPTGVLDSLYQYLTFGPNQAMTMAQSQAQNALTSQQIAQSGANAATSAQAQLAAAQIAASGGLAQQGIQSGTAASIANAGNATQLLGLAGGDRNAAARQYAAQQLEAAKANQGYQSQILGLLASTGLRDQLQARAMTRGFAPQPGFASALGTLGGPLQQVSAVNPTFYGYGSAPAATAANVNMPAFAMPSFSTGGGHASGGTDLASLFASINSSMGSGLGGGFSMTPNTPAAAPPTGFKSKAKDARKGGGGLAKGGKATPGQMRWVGERGPELMIVRPDATEIIPMSKIPGMAYGGTVGSGYSSKSGSTTTPARITQQPYQNPYPTSVVSHAPVAPGPQAPARWSGTKPYSGNAPMFPSTLGGLASKGGGIKAGIAAPPPGISGGQVTTPTSSPGPNTNGSTSPKMTIKMDDNGNPNITIGASVNPGTSTIQPVDAPVLEPMTSPSPLPVGPTLTGQEILNTPAWKYAMGMPVGGYSGNQTFDIPEEGITGLPGPAMLAKLLGPSTPLNSQETDDLLTILVKGGYSLPAISDITNRFTPGWRGNMNAQAVGY